MNKPSDEDRDAAPADGSSAKDEREARLAAALRANLRRRKAAAPKRAAKPARDEDA